MQEAVDLLSQAASKAVDKVEHSGKYLRDSETRMVSGCRGYVRAKPLTSVGLAVASGFLLSWALRQR